MLVIESSAQARMKSNSCATVKSLGKVSLAAEKNVSEGALCSYEASSIAPSLARADANAQAAITEAKHPESRRYFLS
jgi:hypothetical protein